MPSARACCNPPGSLLDYVQESSKSLSRTLDSSDRALVNDYLQAVREVEAARAEVVGQGRFAGQPAECAAGRAG